MKAETLHIWSIEQELAHAELGASMRELRALVAGEIEPHQASAWHGYRPGRLVGGDSITTSRNALLNQQAALSNANYQTYGSYGKAELVPWWRNISGWMS